MVIAPVTVLHKSKQTRGPGWEGKVTEADPEPSPSRTPNVVGGRVFSDDPSDLTPEVTPTCRQDSAKMPVVRFLLLCLRE